MTQRLSFLGVPVEGNIDKSRNDNLPQRPIEEFQEVFGAVLGDPTIVDFGWEQYTPYFNDGEPCHFNTYGFWIRTVVDVALAEDDEDDDGDKWKYGLDGGEHPSLGKVMSPWDSEVKKGDALAGEYRGQDRARYDRCRELSAAVLGGEFYDALYDLFGDHAEIHVHKDRIVVHEYSHD